MSRCAAAASRRRWTRTSRTKPFWSTARHSQCASPAIRDDDFIQMPFVAASRRTLADRVSEGLAEFLPPWRTVSHGTQIPRAANLSSTIRRLKGNRKYSQTAWLITSGGKRWRRSRRSRAQGAARL